MSDEAAGAAGRLRLGVGHTEATAQRRPGPAARRPGGSDRARAGVTVTVTRSAYYAKYALPTLLMVTRTGPFSHWQLGCGAALHCTDQPDSSLSLVCYAIRKSFQELFWKCKSI